jgi:hypothetical protein
LPVTTKKCNGLLGAFKKSETENQSGRCGEEKNPSPYPELNPIDLAHSQVSVLNEINGINEAVFVSNKRILSVNELYVTNGRTLVSMIVSCEVPLRYWVLLLMGE